ncbi:MAG: beta-lactamase induction signal transducer AmpG [Idiomarinaceae bacterium HL-53]|nr:MAG: beta-lactamase induction signal transducer AmpG [Idiomarinaceae bacterium HL-53]CUS49470.1 MFS transporter, PAT family, beta-lactamase induction signal transducer AmpG [Idiomarinaceae bacterium HL-53]
MQKNTLSNPADIIRFYLQKRLLVIFVFGVASGFPWVLIGSAMSAWLNESGVSRTAIGYFGVVFAMYSINFLWSPLVDRLRIPVLCQKLGHRRGWILFCQLAIIASCLALAQIDLSQHSLHAAGLIALSVAIFSATQDIAIDGYRIDSIAEHEGRMQSAGAGMAVSGWWTGFAGLGAIPFFLSDSAVWNWSSIYILLAGIVFLIAVVGLIADEPKTNRDLAQREAELKYQRAATLAPNKALSIPIMGLIGIALLGWAILGFRGLPEALFSQAYWLWLAWFGIQCVLVTAIIRALLLLQKAAHSPANKVYQQIDNPITQRHRVAAWLIVTLVEPLADFFQRNGVRFALSILLFVLLFKVGEAFLGRMSIVFYQEVGFTNSQIGTYSKLLNWGVTILFSLVGSYVTMRTGIIRGLFIGGIAMAMSNLFFAVIAYVGPSVPLLVVSVVIDGFTTSWSTVAFVGLISILANRAFTASQYALMASIATMGRTVLGSSSGALVDWLNGNWALFFVLTTLMVIPGLLFLYSIRKPIQRIEDENKAKTAAYEAKQANE